MSERPGSSFVFTREAVREVDRRAIEDYGMCGLVLMENAALGLLWRLNGVLHGRFGGVAGRRVLMVAGGGNNGGDVFAVARHLHNQRVDVNVVAVRAFDAYSGDAGANLAVLRKMGVDVVEGGDDPVGVLDGLGGGYDLVVDGLFGTGLSSEVRGAARGVIEWMNGCGVPIVAVDVPSGLDCDTGEPLGVAVRAERTVTFVGLKRGFTLTSCEYTGEVDVVGIGVPRALVEALGEWIDSEM